MKEKGREGNKGRTKHYFKVGLKTIEGKIKND